MERDALLAHGTSFLLQDRLMNCSDYSTAWVCRSCGSMVSLGYDQITLSNKLHSAATDGPDLSSGPGGEYCRSCRAKAVDEYEAREKKQKKVHGTGLVFEKNVAGGPQGGELEVVAVPFVFRLLVAELASMGIQISVRNHRFPDPRPLQSLTKTIFCRLASTERGSPSHSGLFLSFLLHSHPCRISFERTKTRLAFTSCLTAKGGGGGGVAAQGTAWRFNFSS